MTETTAARTQETATVIGPVLESPADFASLGLGPMSLKAIADLGYDLPTTIQVKATLYSFKEPT